MRRQEEMNILPHERGQVYLFMSLKFHLQGKGVGFDFLFHIGQAGDALHADPNGDLSGGKEPAFAQPDIQRIGQRRDRHGAGFLQPQWRGALFTFQMKRFSLRYLANMNFHYPLPALPYRYQGVNVVPRSLR